MYVYLAQKALLIRKRASIKWALRAESDPEMVALNNLFHLPEDKSTAEIK